MSEVTEKADHCNRLLNDPYLKQAFEDVQQAVVDSFLTCDEGDTELLYRLKCMTVAITLVSNNLRSAVQDGQLEQINLEADDKVAPFLGTNEDLAKWRKRQA